MVSIISMEGRYTDSKDFLGKIVKIEIDRPIGSEHPKRGFIYPINYGFVPDTLSPDEEPLDAYVLGVSEPVKNFEGRCIAIIHRTNDNDDKLIIVPNGTDFSDEDIINLTNFQERFYKSVIIR